VAPERPPQVSAPHRPHRRKGAGAGPQERTEVFTRHGGVVVNPTGDGFFVAFGVESGAAGSTAIASGSGGAGLAATTSRFGGAAACGLRCFSR